MKFNTAIIISFVTLLLGFFFEQSHLWMPLSVLGAGVIYLFTRQWVMSDRVGQMQKLSMTLKSIFALVGFYATIGQVACIGLVVWWFIF